MSGISGINNLSNLNSLYSMLSYGSSASAIGRRVSGIYKIGNSISRLEEEESAKAASAAKAADAAEKTSSASSADSASDVSRTARLTAQQRAGQLNSAVSTYRTDLADVTEKAAALSSDNAQGAFNFYEYGTTDENTVSLQTKNSLGEDRSFHIDVTALADPKTGAQAQYSITENGVRTDYTSASNQVDLGNGNSMTLKAAGSADVYTGVDADKITSAMGSLVDAYNKVRSDVPESDGAGSLYGALSGSSRNGVTTDSMKAVGLSYDTNGKLSLDRDRFQSALADDFDSVKDAVGGTYGIAAQLQRSASDRVTDAISDSMSSAFSGSGSAFGGLTGSLGSVGSGSSSGSYGSGSTGSAGSLGEAVSSAASSDDYSSVRNLFSSMYQFSAAGPYNLSNYYTVGSLFNEYA